MRFSFCIGNLMQINELDLEIAGGRCKVFKVLDNWYFIVQSFFIGQIEKISLYGPTLYSLLFDKVVGVSPISFGY